MGEVAGLASSSGFPKKLLGVGGGPRIMRFHSFWIALIAAACFLASPVIATETHQPAPTTAADLAEIEAFSSYTAEAGAIVQQLLGVLTDMIDYSNRYLLAFANTEAFESSRGELDKGFNSLSERVAAARDRAAALGQPPPLAGHRGRVSVELQNYVGAMLDDVAAMKSDFDRLPAFAAAKDAKGFDAARAKLSARASAMLRAENALLTIAQTGQSIGAPEFHLMEAIKNSNSVVAEFLDQMLASQKGAAAPAKAAQITLYRKGADISLDAAESLTQTLKNSLMLQNPGQVLEINACVSAYEESIAAEREFAALLDVYVAFSAELEAGRAIPDLQAQLTTVGAKSIPVIRRRLAAARMRQEAGLALVKAATPTPTPAEGPGDKK